MGNVKFSYKGLKIHSARITGKHEDLGYIDTGYPECVGTVNEFNCAVHMKITKENSVKKKSKTIILWYT